MSGILGNSNSIGKQLPQGAEKQIKSERYKKMTRAKELSCIFNPCPWIFTLPGDKHYRLPVIY